MLEWTFCAKCGKILDNSQTTCKFCGNEVEKIHMEYLTGYLSNLTFIVRTLAVFNPAEDYEAMIYDDLLGWFSYLAWADDEITDNEIEFINSLLGTEYTAEDIPKKDELKLPQSFKKLEELESSVHEFDITNVDCTSLLYKNYELLGKFFITVDDDLDLNVFKRYLDFINFLRDNITIRECDVPLNIPSSKAEEETASLDEYLEELNRLVGLDSVKKDVNSLINLVQIRKLREERGIKQPPMSLHLVFSGNPGTGKTTVARLLAKIYHEIGILSQGHLIETDRSGLVGGYVGQTAIKTQEVIQSAMGGILFIDEAYSLASSSENDYGQEAINTILKAMEDHRDDLIVIVAGYPALMDNFLHSNPGLESRFNKFIYFEDYSGDELYNIFWLMCEDANLTMDEAADKYIKEYFDKMCENKSGNFANARAVRNFFEEVITAQANRLAPQSEITDEELNTLTYEDFLCE